MESYNPKEYWEKRSDDWVTEDFSFEPWKSILDKYIDWDVSTTEIGCGTSRWGDLFTNYTGIDISQKLINYAHKYHPERKLYCEDIREIIVTDKQIFSFTCLEHIPTEDFDKLRLKGKLIVIEPNKPSQVNYCFNHDYYKLGLKEVHREGDLSLWLA
jgi:hypothetical protein